MGSNRRIENLEDYTGVLPYASEIFGVYQPIIGWRSSRAQERRTFRGVSEQKGKIIELAGSLFEGRLNLHPVSDNDTRKVLIGSIEDTRADIYGGELLTLIKEISSQLQGNVPQGNQWCSLVNEGNLLDILNGPVFSHYQDIHNRPQLSLVTQQDELFIAGLKKESSVAGMLLELANKGSWALLESIFFSRSPRSSTLMRQLSNMAVNYEDPYTSFDPNRDIDNVSLSPLGIVHLFRQYFFELDTFLGTPVSHVWLSPGATVELIEVSTRKETVEKTIETEMDSTTKTEKGSTEQDDISGAVKMSNRDDNKLGFSSTVNQTWATGNATATGNINMDKTQESAREDAKKRMRQQTEKLSTEIRQSFKSTFKTVTETTDMSSKRYVLSNTTQNLINYELRRKMRQVGIQVQDIGTYLCWETFVDNLFAGEEIILPNLVHVSKPADLVVVPNANDVPTPVGHVTISISGTASYNFPNNDRQYNGGHPETNNEFVPLNTLQINNVPADYEVDPKSVGKVFPVNRTMTAAGDDESWKYQNALFFGIITQDSLAVIVGMKVSPDGNAWDKRLDYSVNVPVRCTMKASKVKEINDANSANIAAKAAANADNQRKLEEAYVNSVRERIKVASKIRKRPFEDLREEERTIVYRNLISSLVGTDKSKFTGNSSSERYHTLSELINSVFDIDKMLYFVAPEWWKPRATNASLNVLNDPKFTNVIDGSTIRWSNGKTEGGYFITEESDTAAYGSSLGWLLQLDGDSMRNMFLNAPWVKAVVPVRPGKETAAISWLKNVGVEGYEGLGSVYLAPGGEAETSQIRANLLKHNPNDEVRSHTDVTVLDAIRALCNDVTDKHSASLSVGRYPLSVDDENRVSATPLDKVYEHGFDPLQGGFRSKPSKSETFEVYDQWIEVLPTDQVVPVEVSYNPLTGRQTF